MTSSLGIAIYDHTKDSRVDWLGEIPESWQVKRMKYLFRDVSEKNKPEAELLSVTQNQGVVPRTWVENRMVMPSGNLESFKFIEKGDFAISLRSFEGGLEYCHHDGIISPAYTVLKKCISELVEGYYKYLFKSYSFISELQTCVVGIREGKNISFEELSYSLMPIPSKEEQNAIAEFLDKNTEQIDQAIAIKEKQIDLLKERKQILIQNAVTRGLDSNVPMKDSGVDWVGCIPECWEVRPIKYLGTISNGYAFNSEEFCETGCRVMKISNIQTMSISWEDSSYISDSYFFSQKKFRVKCGDLVFALTRPVISTGIKAAIVESKERILLNQRNAMLRPSNKVATRWLYYLILNQSFVDEFSQQIDITGQQPNISTGDIGNLKVPVPKKAEQIEIVEYLDNKIIKLDKCMLSKKTQIEQLKEYKTTLINSAVTGKIKVA